MLVVPNHWGDAPIIPGTPYASRLRGWAESGIEIFLHGFSHRDDSSHSGAGKRLKSNLMTAGEGEFLGLSEDQARARIADGRALLESIIGRSIDGFIAPAWLYGEGALRALEQERIVLAEDHFKVWSPASGAKLASGPVITWASRTRMRLLSSLAAAAVIRNFPIDVLRVGVHPPDVRHPRILGSIERTLKVATNRRQVARYSDLIPLAA